MTFTEGNTRSFHRFLNTVGRSIGLIKASLDLSAPAAGKGHEDAEVVRDDIMRAAIVLAVAAMDNYFTNRFVEMFIPFLKTRGPTKGLLDLLGKAGFDTKLALEMLTMERPYRRLRSLVDSYLDRFVTQRFEVIDSLFLAYGVKNFTHSVQAKIGRKTLLRSIEILVERRHAIVHGGDLNAHNCLVDIDGSEVLRRITDMEVFVTGAEKFLNSLVRVKKLPSPSDLLERVWREAWKPPDSRAC